MVRATFKIRSQARALSFSSFIAILSSYSAALSSAQKPFNSLVALTALRSVGP
jgi:hypothetical protein